MKNKLILLGWSKKYRVGLSKKESKKARKEESKQARKKDRKKESRKERLELHCEGFEHCATEVGLSNILAGMLSKAYVKFMF